MFPETVSQDEVAGLVLTLVSDPAASPDYVLRCLDELGDYQWHTYEYPGEPMRQQLSEWLLRHWRSDPEFLETVCGVAYCFALPRSILERALSECGGGMHDEYVEALAHSPGEFVDPYWSLERT